MNGDFMLSCDDVPDKLYLAMSGKTQHAPSVNFSGWLVPLAAGAVMVAAVISYGRAEIKAAAAGSPYYGKAVTEAINGLKNPGTPAAPAAESIPPLPAGLSPADYYWCPNCKSYHPRQPQQTAPPAAGGVPYLLAPPPVPEPAR